MSERKVLYVVMMRDDQFDGVFVVHTDIVLAYSRLREAQAKVRQLKKERGMDVHVVQFWPR